MDKKSLIKILQNNGTGLLKGLCRPVEFNSFEEIPEIEGNENGEAAEGILVAFSLNQENLGSCMVNFESLGSFDTENRFIDATISSGKVLVGLTIRWISIDPEFAEFEAMLYRK